MRLRILCSHPLPHNLEQTTCNSILKFLWYGGSVLVFETVYNINDHGLLFRNPGRRYKTWSVGLKPTFYFVLVTLMFLFFGFQKYCLSSQNKPNLRTFVSCPVQKTRLHLSPLVLTFFPGDQASSLPVGYFCANLLSFSRISNS